MILVLESTAQETFGQRAVCQMIHIQHLPLILAGQQKHILVIHAVQRHLLWKLSHRLHLVCA